jgi:predicted transposase
MHCTITAKLRLHTTPAQFHSLRQTQLAYRDALNYVSGYAFAHGKMSNKVALQEGTYLDVRAKFRLPAQMACSVPRQVGATYKALWTKVTANAAARAARKTKKRYKGLDTAPRYISPTLTYQLGHDYSFKADRQVSILTLDGRVIVPYAGYGRHVALIQQGAHIGAAKLWYDKPHKQFYLLVSLEIAVADPSPEQHQRIIGVDVGQRYLAVATDTQNKTTFFPGKEARASGPLCPAAEAIAAQRHSLGNTIAHRAGGARETVEARSQPPHQPADCGCLPAQPHRPGGPDPHPRTGQADAWQESYSETA